MTRTADLDRAAIVRAFDFAMRGAGSLNALPFAVRGGPVRTYILEANVGDDSHAMERADRFAFDIGGGLVQTADYAMALVVHELGGMAIDLVDPRFWLVHVAGPSAWADELVASNVRRATDLDWCWLPMSHLDAMQALGRTRWFKSDFEGDELLGDYSEGARRLKVQLEGRDADRLRRYIAQLPEYRTANSLTGLAVDVENTVGTVREAAHYRGSFKVAGDSFDAHQLFLGSVVTRYASSVRHVEATAGIRWEPAGETGRRLVGGVIEIKVTTPISAPMAFAEQLLSAREPFRLWGIPTAIGQELVEAEAVDLHIGKAFRLDILENSLRLYLDAGVCGNTVFRLLANLQHRYDATATAWLGQELIA